MCAGKTMRDGAVFTDVADGEFSLVPTTERFFIELAKKDGYYTYFRDLFRWSTWSEVGPHQE